MSSIKKIILLEKPVLFNFKLTCRSKLESIKTL